MVSGQLHYLIEEKKSKSDGNSTSPFLGFEYLFLFCTVFNIMNEFFSALLFFLLPQIHYGDSNACYDEKLSSEPEICNNESSGCRDFEKLERDQVKMVMAKLGLSCSLESEELQEQFGSKELSVMFEEQEPSLEELKDAFDVFDENKDGFFDASELQRVLIILGLKEARTLENCQKMIRKYDVNQDGRIDFNEFVKIMENCFC
ncbi:hypothetical protein PIB30_085295 [Stylosanthes scabra]|uniref:EF-hand domain-containing protein n=1 Tax=Stylosanthes scabra TaxID=79078 RepID=A0ABU6URP6_9FABA|nr:hypothetical protein [Stylosanthes scabra]